MNRNKMTLGVSYSPPPGSPEQIQRDSFVSSKHYSTMSASVKTPVKAQPSAETKALGLLRESGFKTIQQLDWVAKDDKGNWVVFEIKQKELFTPGVNFPYFGAGLNLSQLYLRTRLLKDLGLRTYLLIFAKGTNQIFGAYLDELEKGEFYDTKNGIRIYPIDSFKAIEPHHNGNLGGLA